MENQPETPPENPVTTGMEKMRRDLVEVYREYLQDPTDGLMKKKARDLHTEYGNVGPHMDRITRHAVNLLVDVGYDLKAPPKPSRQIVQNLVYALEKMPA